MLQLQPRMIIRHESTNAIYRILKVSVEDIWLIMMNSPDAFPFRENPAILEAGVMLGEYVEHVPTTFQTISDASRNSAIAKYNRLSKAFDDLENLLTEGSRASVFRALRENDPLLSYKLYIKSVRQWLCGGFIVDALSPAWWRCGPSKKIDVVAAKKIPFATAQKEVRISCESLRLEIRNVDASERLAYIRKKYCELPGRKRDNFEDSATLFRVTTEAIAVFKRYFDWKLKERSKRTLNDAYKKMIAETFSQPDAFGVAIIFEDFVIPTPMQFDSWFKRIYPYVERRRKQVGAKQFDLNERGLPGNQASTAQVAGAVAQVDATVWNVSIRSRLSGRPLVGCPIVFRARCKKSGMLLGLAITLENSTWELAMSTLENCVLDKVEYCAKYNIQIAEEDWPVSGLPSTIDGDRGEVYSKKAGDVIRATGIRFRNMPALRPDLKGGVESDFRTLQIALDGTTAGACVSKWMDAGNKWKVEAELDIDQFTEKLLRAELRRMRTPIQEPKLTAAMINAGVDGSPLSIWNWSIANEAGGLQRFGIEEVRMALLTKSSATIRANGVAFGRCLYWCDELDETGAFSKARLNGRKKIRVAYDNRLVDHIYLLMSDDPRDYVVCYLNELYEHQRDWLGMSFAEVDALLRDQKRNQEKEGHERLQAAVNDLMADERVNADAKRMTRESIAITKSKSAQLRELPAARREERFNHREEVVIRLEHDPMGKGPEVVESIEPVSQPNARDDRRMTESKRNLSSLFPVRNGGASK